MCKLFDIFYIVYFINVGNILEKVGFSEEVIVVVYLYDVVEDISVIFEEIV